MSQPQNNGSSCHLCALLDVTSSSIYDTIVFPLPLGVVMD